jgi:CMP-N,N'-diacetyllegionaminic acid synthase
MTRLCTVCVRGGSKGVPNKNIRDLGGKPLVAYSLEQARASDLFDAVAVSSDSQEILDIARAHGADLLVTRPAALATDTAAKLPVIRHCFEEAERLSGRRFDVIVDLDATSPLRSVADIRGAVDLLEREQVANVITGTPARRSPYFNLVELADDGSVRLSKPPKEAIVRRQDAPACFDMNASIYVWCRAALLDYPTVFNADTRLFVMPEDRSVDIDSPLDFQIVELLMTRRNRK